MLHLTMITKTKPNQMELALIEVAKKLIGEFKTRSQVLAALENEISVWKSKRQKYRNSATRVSIESGSITVFNTEGQMVFTIN